jgi:adenylosuccinate synthase
VVVKYTHMINEYSSLCLTKLDVLSGLEELKIGVKYKLNGKELESFPGNLEDLEKVEVVYETMPGWKADISKVREFGKLPENAQKYVLRIEEIVGVPIKWIGVGPGRDDIVLK